MKRKIVAVLNDQKGSIHAVLKGYEHYLPFSGIPSEHIDFNGYSYGKSCEYNMIVLDHFGFTQELSTENYSLLYDDEVESKIVKDSGEKGCTMCNYPHGFYRSDTLGGEWKIGDKTIEITQRYREYAGAPVREEVRKMEINYCPWCGNKLGVPK